jgi:hypothetical protein
LKRLLAILSGILLTMSVAGEANALNIMYEDAEDGDTLGWSVVNGFGTITNVFDEDRQNRVIDLSGYGTMLMILILNGA